MHWELPLQVITPHIFYALFGAFTFIFGLFSLFLREKLYIGEAIWAFAFGVIMGPYGLNIFDPRSWDRSSDPDEPSGTIIVEFMRMVLIVGMFAMGIELPKAYIVKRWKSLFFLIVPVTTWSWFVCAGLIYAFIPGLNFLSSLAVSACLIATDPVLASAIVGGRWADKHVPAHIRHLLAAESGCNEGAALAFLFLALRLIVDLPNVGTAMKSWFFMTWLYEIALSVAIGLLLGFSFRHLMKFSQRRKLISLSYIAQYVSLAMLTVGITSLLGTDDLMAAFICGATSSWDNFSTEKYVFSSGIDGLFNVAAFIFVGAWMLFGDFHINGGLGTGLEVWRLVVLAVLILLSRRLPIMMGLYRWIPELKTWKEAAFFGHFGPMGISAIFLSTLASEFLRVSIERHPSLSTGPNQQQIEFFREKIETVIAFVVLCSIIIHGLSVPGFSLGKRVHSLSRSWSRSDTTESGRGAPNWTNRPTFFTEPGDFIIINDLENGGMKGLTLNKTMTMDMTQKAKFQLPASVTPSRQSTFDRNHHRHQFLYSGENYQSSEWRGDQRVPDGYDDNDAEITVINDSSNHRTSTNGNVNATYPWISRRLFTLESGTEETGHWMRDGGGRMAMANGKGKVKSSNTLDTLVDDGAWMANGKVKVKVKSSNTLDTLVNDEA